MKQAQGVLGYAIAGVVDEGSGWLSQRFERGYLLYDGARKVMYWLPSSVWDYWKARGGLGGAIGAPTASPSGSAAAGWVQTFTKGRISVSPTGVVTSTP